jgi:hypothetical protein
MHRVLGAATVAALVLVVALAATPGQAAVDPARIVPWVSIGNARIGDTAADVKRMYGKPAKVEEIGRALPISARWHGHRVVDRTYRVRGGELWVRTVDGRVRAVGTTSPRYVTPRGIRTGLRIAPRCQKDSSGNCLYLWRGFVFRECTGWVYGRRGLVVSLGWKRERVDRIAFGDPDALPICA